MKIWDDYFQEIADDLQRKVIENPPSFMTPETAPTPKFAIGDVVRLKSGGPLMTVSEHDITFGTVLAKWFDESSLCESWFHALSLKLAE